MSALLEAPVPTEAVISEVSGSILYDTAVLLVRSLVSCSHRLHYHLHEISEGKPVRFVDKAAVQMTLALKAMGLLDGKLEAPNNVLLAISFLDHECERLRLSR